MLFNFSKTNTYRPQRNLSKLQREKRRSRQKFGITDMEFKTEMQGLNNPRLITYDITFQKSNWSATTMETGFDPMPSQSILDNHESGPISSTMLWREAGVLLNYECWCTHSCASSWKPKTWTPAPNHAKNKADDSSRHKRWAGRAGLVPRVCHFVLLVCPGTRPH